MLQTVKIRDTTSSPIILNISSSRRCVLSPLLFTLLTYDCKAGFPNNHIVKFLDDTALVGLISSNTSCITVWYGNCSAADSKALQRIVKAAQKICSLPSINDIYISRCRSKATSIMKDATHPARRLFVLLPSGRRLQSIKARTTRMKNSFYSEAVRIMNTRP